LGASSFVELSEDWLLMLKSDMSDTGLKKLCSNFAEKCIASGHPSAGGVPFVEVRGTVRDLEGYVSPGEVEFIEPDMVTRLVPEMPSRFMKDFGDSSDFDDAHGSSSNSSKGLSSETDDPAPKTEVDINAHPLWGMERIGVAETPRTGKGVHIYVLDSGIHSSHVLFGGRAVPTLEVTGSEVKLCEGAPGCAVDTLGHGTHCASIAAGDKIGVAPGATIHGVKIVADEGEGNVAWTLAALDYIATEGERPAVVSMSLGGGGQSHAEEAGIDAVTRAGVTVVVAAGNENDDACKYSPSFVESAITVAAIDRTDSRGTYSNYGSCVDIFAPGSDIASAGLETTSAMTFKTGTSMACPVVAGAVAMLLETNPLMQPAQVRAALLESAEKGAVAHRQGSPNRLLSLRSGKFQISPAQEEGSSPQKSTVESADESPAKITSEAQEVVASPREPSSPQESVTKLGEGTQEEPETSAEAEPAEHSTGEPSCPSFAEDSEPDVGGDCTCKPGTTCSMGDSYGCEWSVPGSRSKQYFSATCSSCVCS